MSMYYIDILIEAFISELAFAAWYQHCEDDDEGE